MNVATQHRRDAGFFTGLLTGAFVGAGLTVWLAPRIAAEIRERATDAAKDLRNRASDGYRQASARVGEAVDDVTEKGQSIRDDVADAVVHGAHEVARQATAMKTGG